VYGTDEVIELPLGFSEHLLHPGPVPVELAHLQATTDVQPPGVLFPALGHFLEITVQDQIPVTGIPGLEIQVVRKSQIEQPLGQRLLAVVP
jgi:hypothetical protein